MAFHLGQLGHFSTVAGTNSWYNGNMYRVYLITNLINDKVYVGLTKRDIKLRWAEHVQFSTYPNKRGIVLYHAIRKYGKESFDVATLGTTDTFESAAVLEQMWIHVYKSSNNKFGYNLTLGGETGPRTELARKHMSEARTGKPLSESHKQSIARVTAGSGNPFYGKKHTPEARKKISESHSWEKHKDYKHEVSNEEIKNLYESGLSTRQVGKIVGLTGRSIVHRMKILGMPRRNRLEALALSRK